MKKQWYYFNYMCREITDYKRSLWLWFGLRIIVQTVLPLMQLLLSAQVIQWLLEGVSVETYLSKLAVWVVAIGVVEVIDKRLLFYFEKECDIFRLTISKKMTHVIYTIDYPSIISEEGQKLYAKASELAASPSHLFGRYINELSQLLSALIGLVMYMSLVLQVDQLYLVLISALVLGLLIFKVLQKRIAPKITEARSFNGKQNRYLSRLYGDLRLAKDIRLYQMGDWFKDIQSQIAAEYRVLMRPKNKLVFAENTFFSVGTILITIFAYFQSVQLIATGQLAVSDFVVYVGAVTLLAGTITQFVNQVAILDRDLAEVKYYDEFMNQEPVFNHGHGLQVPTQNLTIELKNVSYTYPNQTHKTLNNVSVTFHPSEKVAIVGENGAGKTTLIKLILGLLLPDEGEILLNGQPQGAFNIKDYYTLFSAVFQDSFLLTYTIRETILQGLAFDEAAYQRVLELSGVDKIIEHLPQGDQTHIVRDVSVDAIQLSGGQLQKLKLAQALYKDAPILVLDEPTAALDPLAEDEIYQDYLRFSDEKLSFFISHRLSSTRFCDRIIYLKQGEVTEIGNHQELIAMQKDYYRLYEAQAYYYREELEGLPNQAEASQELEVGGVI